jgi:predicted permease
MTEVVYVLAPVLALGLIGYFSTRLGFFSGSHRDGLSKYVFDFAVPMLLFSAVVELESPKASATMLFVSYYIPLVAVFAAGLIVSWLLLRRPVVESMIIGLGS